METLVLDAAYQPTAIVPWQRAMVLKATQKVEDIIVYEDRFIRTVRVEFPMPSVIRLVSGSKSRKRAVKFSRQNVYTRDRGRCQYCGDTVPQHLSTYDHVVPRAQGGKTTWENVVICCMGCNQRKGNRTPAQSGMKLLSKPVKPKNLPGVVSITYRKGMPPEWRQFLSDSRYWNGELEHDE